MPKLILKDGSIWEGESFGANRSVAGEVVFATGMVGYPESLTDPSYQGQILVLTYPLAGNYGVPKPEQWESSKIHVAGLVVCNYIDTPSHADSQKTLGQWLKEQNIPALEIKDTRGLAQKLRDQGALLGKMILDKMPSRAKRNHLLSGFKDPNLCNLVAEVSTKKILHFGPSISFGTGHPDVKSGLPAIKNIKGGKKTLLLYDCGAKRNIIRELVKLKLKVVVVPWDFNFSSAKFAFDGIVVSNGPGDPKKAGKTIVQVKKALKQKIPLLGICLGNQILALAAGGDTYKLKFGHRGQNQPCRLLGTDLCFLTTQNHGFAVGKIPPDFKPWFENANDQTNEGIIHKDLPFMSVQFHPESSPGPLDTGWIFEEFLKKLR